MGSERADPPPLPTGARPLTLALVLPGLSDPYFGELASLVGAAARRRGHTVRVHESGGDRDREAALLREAVDGLILSPLALTAADLADRAGGGPLVLLGERLGVAVADHVAVDNPAAAGTAVRHLLDLGRRRIAFVGAQAAVGTAGARLAGYRRALAAAGRAVDPRLIVAAAPFDRSAGAAVVERLLRRRPGPDAIFCATDTLALGAIRAVLEHGYRIPQDIAVVGFDDIEDGRYGTPTLTTIRPDKEAIAEAAVRLVGTRAAESGGDRRQVVVGHRLVIRESTAGASDQPGTGPAAAPSGSGRRPGRVGVTSTGSR